MRVPPWASINALEMVRPIPAPPLSRLRAALPVEAFEDVSELARWDALADKTVLKMMRQMGLRCGIRRERAYRRYNSYKGDVGQSFANIIGRNFKADGPWQKLGTDVTEFKLSFGKADLDAYITHWNTTRRQVKLKGLTRQNTGIRPYGKPHNGYH